MSKISYRSVEKKNIDLSELQVRNAEKSFCVPRSHTPFCFCSNILFFNGDCRGQEASTFQAKCSILKRIAGKFILDSPEYSLFTLQMKYFICGNITFSLQSESKWPFFYAKIKINKHLLEKTFSQNFLLNVCTE